MTPAERMLTATYRWPLVCCSWGNLLLGVLASILLGGNMAEQGEGFWCCYGGQGCRNKGSECGKFPGMKMEKDRESPVPYGDAHRCTGGGAMAVLGLYPPAYAATARGWSLGKAFHHLLAGRLGRPFASPWRNFTP